MANTRVSIKHDRSKIIERLQEEEDAHLILRVKMLLEDHDNPDEVGEDHDDEYAQMVDEILAEYDKVEEPLITDLHPPNAPTPLERMEDLLAAPMFWLSVLALATLSIGVLLAGLQEEIAYQDTLVYLASTLGGILEVIFIADFMILAVLARREGVPIKRVLFRVLGVVAPPLRLGMRRYSNRDQIWLPSWQWCKANEMLFLEVQRRFGTPMLIVAFFIIPIMLLDMKFKEQALQYIPDLQFYLEISQAFIWGAFTFEFVLMFFITNEKLDYVKKNWIDLLIIILPLVYFLRSVRVLRLARLNSLAKVYRMRGVIMKIRQALVLADFVQRIMFPNPQAQLKSLQKKLKYNKQQRLEIERLTLMAVERIKKRNEKKAKKEERKQQKKASKNSTNNQ